MKYKLPRFTKSFYFISGLFFMVWILFLDSNDLVTQLSLRSKISDLESQKDYYQENIDEISSQYNRRENDLELIEKYAREQYFMKKDSEDIYVVVEK